MPTSLESSIVRVCTPDGDVVGAGFLVGARQILTCAHVIAGTLGLPDDTPEKPQTPVHLDFPRVAPKRLFTARVILWRPPQADGGGDIAGLELEDDPPQGAQVAHLARVDDLWEHSFRAFGFPKGEEAGVWATGRLLGRQGTDWVQIEDVKETGFPVEPGFSGTPVWDTQLEAVVGMVVAAERRIAAKTAFAIPVDVLVSTWPLLESLIQPFVFLCYARADSELVMRLRTDLATRGINIWIDREGLEPGTPDWEESLRTAIRAAQAVLLIASPNGRSSRYVRDELRLAEMYQRPLYPIWMIGTQWMDAVPLGWGGAQYIDARESSYETALGEIVAALNGISSALSRNIAPFREPEQDSEPRNPYKGLRAFTSEDAGDFFGRDTLINALVETLKKSLAKDVQGVHSARLLVVIGPSGSGKSSVVMAGLLPRLEQDGLPGSREWVYLTPIVPGMHPIESLTLALAEQLPDRSLKTIREDLEDDSARGLHLLASHIAKRSETRVVLLVDQFEEVFTQTTSEEERRRFLDILVTAITEPCGPLVVLLTLRADFYDRPSQYPELALLIKDHHQLVLPMDMKDLHAVIEKPAALPDVQLTFEGDLVGDLLFEMQGQAGPLPLLQFTLEQLFQKRSGHLLTLAAYREMGGVKGALTRQAESTYTALPSEEHRRLARALFVRLIDPGVTEQDTTRRRASLSEFALTDAAQTRLLRETADAFIAARLLTTNEVAGTTTLEVSHEALIREWTRLSEWLREARDDISLQQSISEDVADWVRRGRPVDRVYRGSQLTEAQAWAERNVPSRDEVAFLQASVTEHEQQQAMEQNQRIRELTLQRRVVSRQRLLVIALSIFLVVVTIAGTFAGVGFLQANAQRQQAEKERQNALLQAHIANSRALAAQANYALVKNQVDRGFLLSVKANQTYNTFEARDSLLTTLEYSPRLLMMLHSSLPVATLAFSSDGQTLTSFDLGGQALSWDMKTKEHHLSPLDYEGHQLFHGLVISPNDQMVAAASGEGLWVWSTRTGISIAQLEGRTQGLPTPAIDFPAIAFSPDGRTLASSRCSQYTNGSCTQGRILLWNLASTNPSSQLLISQASIARSLAFSPDGKTLASSNVDLTSSNSDGIVQLWDIASKGLKGQLDIGHSKATDIAFSPEKSIAFSPDGKMLATGNADGTIILWDVASKKPVGSPLIGTASTVRHLAFSPDNKILASSSNDKTIRLWDVTTGNPIGEPLVGNTESISDLAFSPDGKLLASGENNAETIMLWNMVTDSSIKQQLEYTEDLSSAVFSPDGKVIIAGDTQGVIILREATTGKSLGTLDATIDPVKIPLQNNQENPLMVQSLSFSPDGRILAAGRLDGTILLWDMRTRQLITHFRREIRLNSLAFNPDGHILASNYESGSILLWDVATRKVLYQLAHHAQYSSTSIMAFSRDGKILASGNDDTVILWDVATGKRTGQPLLGHTANVESVAFSPDGHTLASIDENSTVIFWNMEARKSIGQPLFNLDQGIDGGTGFQAGFTFSPNGALLASGGDSVTLWDVAKRERVAHGLQDPQRTNGNTQPIDVMFSPNGQQLAVVSNVTYSDFNRITLWDINTKSWQALACRIANRNFTALEWRQFSSDESYQKVCPNLPIDGSVVREKLDQAHAAALAGHHQDASLAYTQAVQLTMESDDAEVSARVCWQGNSDQLARVVLPACDYAIKLDPHNSADYLTRGLAQASIGDTQGASADFRQATQLAMNSIGPAESASVCWSGSLNQFVQIVLPACEYAVKLDPNNVNYHDSRGLARALTGDTQGAIADFQFVVQSANINNNGWTSENYGWTPEKVKERQMWLQELEAGHNPFDAKTLRALQSE